MCAQQEVALVGGGNSAGQAAVFLSQHAARVHMLVRGPGLAASMSRYLIDRIEATPNIELRPHTELDAAARRVPAGLAGVTWRDRAQRRARRSGRCATCSCSSAPTRRPRGSTAAAWRSTRTASCSPAPASATATDGFAAGAAGDRASRACSPWATCASGSVKRVGGAIGEGAAVVAQIHHYLSNAAATA